MGFVSNAIDCATGALVDRHDPVPSLDEGGSDFSILSATPAGLMKEQDQGRRSVLGSIDVGVTLDAALRRVVDAFESIIRR